MAQPKIVYLGCIVLAIMLALAEATPPGIANHPAKASCKLKKYKMCYNLEHVCPKFCPDGCEVECASCKPICTSGGSSPSGPPGGDYSGGDDNQGGDDKGQGKGPGKGDDGDDDGKGKGDDKGEGKGPGKGDDGGEGKGDDGKGKGHGKGDDDKGGKGDDSPSDSGSVPPPSSDAGTPPYSPPTTPSSPPTPVTPSPPKPTTPPPSSPPPPTPSTPSAPAPKTPPTPTPWPYPTPSTPKPSPSAPSIPSAPAPKTPPSPTTPWPYPTPSTPKPSPSTPSTPSAPAPSTKTPPSPTTPWPYPTPSSPKPSPSTPSTPSTPGSQTPPTPTPWPYPTPKPSPSTPPTPSAPATPQTPPSPTTPWPYPPPPSSQSPSTPSPTTPPSSGAAAKKRVRCKNKNYGQCYNQEHVCPASCPTSCEVDCVTCKPVCNCDFPGAVCQDPRFIGGNGITFYFHGKKDKDFCLVTDPNLHINAHFIGKRSENMTRDFTWVQSIGILFNNHRLFLGAQKTSAWDDAKDRLSLAFDGEPIYLPEASGSDWQSHHETLTVTRTSDTNSVVVEAPGKFKISAKVVPITDEESRVHNYGITKDDCFAHLDLRFQFYGLSSGVDGVLGKTYRDDYVSKVKMGVSMPVMGGEREYASSSLFATDCSVSRFNKGQDGGSSLGELELIPSMSCGSGMNGEGVVCKR